MHGGSVITKSVFKARCKFCTESILYFEVDEYIFFHGGEINFIIRFVHHVLIFLWESYCTSVTFLGFIRVSTEISLCWTTLATKIIKYIFLTINFLSFYNKIFALLPSKWYAKMKERKTLGQFAILNFTAN